MQHRFFPLSLPFSKQPEQQWGLCRTPPHEYEPPIIISPDMDPLEVLEACGRDYEPSTFVQDDPEHLENPILVRPPPSLSSANYIENFIVLKNTRTCFKGPQWAGEHGQLSLCLSGGIQVLALTEEGRG
jgi:hypothetical protein